jgi:ubiquinone/menaquinone biosynthesis C-methylase UbiE/ADP-ribose pyrophosphatase YjhB (NUDIX family)/uncharacterized protein YbaR (Trm112 family)
MSDHEKTKLISPYSLLYRWLELLRCPCCHERLSVETVDPSPLLLCSACTARYPVVNGIPGLVIPDRAKPLENFCRQYDALRLQEGWANETPNYYQSLPFRDLSGRHPREWQLRVGSFRLLQKWLLQNYAETPLRILDIGAGSGWMSRELAGQHHVLAIDANAGPHGLAALPWAQRHFMAVQAELERLPFAAGAFDLAIANASLHYTRNIEAVLEKISRVLRPGGKLIVMDSPAYPTAAAALAAHERTQAYYAQMGFPELAKNYGGITNGIFLQQKNFHFTRLRHDFSALLSLKKWLREKIGQPAAARFPVWIGERISGPDEKWKPGRQRAGALVVHNRKLLAFRSEADAQAYWRIPGGGIELNETPEQAAKRELQEELGVTIGIEKLFGPYFRHSHKAEWYFLAEAASDNLPAENTRAPEDDCFIHWLPVDHLANYEIRPPALKWELVEYFCNKT